MGIGNEDFSKWIPYAGAVRRFAAGDVIFDEQLPGDVTYIVRSGSVAIRHGDRVLETVGPGAMIGEMALVDDMPRSAAAVAVTDTELVAMDRARFLFLVQETPTFALEVMHLFAVRLRRANEAVG